MGTIAIVIVLDQKTGSLVLSRCQKVIVAAYPTVWTYGAIFAEPTPLARRRWVTAEEIRAADTLVGKAVLGEILLWAGVVAWLLLRWLGLGGPRRRRAWAGLGPRLRGFRPGLCGLRPRGRGRGFGPAGGFGGIPVVGFPVVVIPATRGGALRSCLLWATAVRVVCSQRASGL